MIEMIDSRDPWARLLFALFVPMSSYIVSAVRLAQFLTLLGHSDIASIVYWSCECYYIIRKYG